MSRFSAQFHKASDVVRNKIYNAEHVTTADIRRKAKVPYHIAHSVLEHFVTAKVLHRTGNAKRRGKYGRPLTKFMTRSLARHLGIKVKRAA